MIDETQMLKLRFQPRTTFMTMAIEYILMPLIRTVMKAKLTAESSAGAVAVAQMQVAGDGVGLRDVVEGHHDDAEEEHRGDGADPVPVRGEDAVLIGRAGPAHQFERAEVGGDEAEAGDPGGHFAAGHEELFAGVGGALQVEADEDDDGEVDRDDEDVDGVEAGQRLARRRMRASCGQAF